MATRVRVDQAALTKYLREDPGIQLVLDGAVQAIEDKAIELAPEHTGYYRKRFSWRRYPLRRRLRNTDPFAHLIEWGSANNPAYAPIRKAVRALGLKFKEAPKSG